MQVATPLVKLWAEQPATGVPPSANATVPPLGGGRTEAVNVTLCFGLAGFDDEARLAVVPTDPMAYAYEAT